MLFLPRVLGIVGRAAARASSATTAARWRCCAARCSKALLALLQAPVRMLAHSLFVLVALTGLKLDWKSPPREASARRWRDAVAPLGADDGRRSALLAAVAAIEPARWSGCCRSACRCCWRYR